MVHGVTGRIGMKALVEEIAKALVDIPEQVTVREAQVVPPARRNFVQLFRSRARGGGDGHAGIMIGFLRRNKGHDQRI